MLLYILTGLIFSLFTIYATGGVDNLKEAFSATFCLVAWPVALLICAYYLSRDVLSPVHETCLPANTKLDELISCPYCKDPDTESIDMWWGVAWRDNHIRRFLNHRQCRDCLNTFWI